LAQWRRREAPHEKIRRFVEENQQLMRETGNLASGGARLLLHLGPGLRQAIDADDVHYVEAKADDTEVRTAAARPVRDVRPLEVLAAAFERHGFVRVHRRYLVNPRRVRLVRRRLRSEDWELTFEAPVNAVLPVSRSALASLWRALGEG
jgi:DNA-binding LytR/AlgR family response regulator